MTSNTPQGMMYAGAWTGRAVEYDKGALLAIARVAYQPAVTQVYAARDALKQGTLFPELDKPFLGYRGVMRG